MSRIGYFASSYYPHLGGVEEVVRRLAGENRRMGGASLVITNRWPKDLAASEEHEGLTIKRFVFRVPERNWRQFGGAMLYGRITANQIRRAVRAHKCRIIHVHCVSSNAYYALALARKLKLPLVVTIHGELTGDSSGLFQRSAFAQRMFRDVLRSATVVTAPSARTLSEAEAFCGVQFGARARVIPNGVNIAEFTRSKYPAGLKSYMLSVGRVVTPKGLDVLIRAFAKALGANTNIDDLVIAGDGNARCTLEQLANELEVGHRVKFVGSVSRENLPELMSGGSLFILPSRQEAFGIAALEAMAAGKAVIATRVGGVPEVVIDGVTGILVPPDNVEELATMMLRLSGDALLRSRLGIEGRQRAEKFSWPVIATQYQQVYETAMAAAAQR